MASVPVLGAAIWANQAWQGSCSSPKQPTKVAQVMFLQTWCNRRQYQHGDLGAHGGQLPCCVGRPPHTQGMLRAMLGGGWTGRCVSDQNPVLLSSFMSVCVSQCCFGACFGLLLLSVALCFLAATVSLPTPPPQPPLMLMPITLLGCTVPLLVLFRANTPTNLFCCLCIVGIRVN